MVYVTSVGPVDPDTGLIVGTGVKDQTRQCLKNLQQKLEDAGSSLEKVVWANWALKEPTDFDLFNEEWSHWFPVEQPVGQGTLMPPGATSRGVPRLARGDRRGLRSWPGGPP